MAYSYHKTKKPQAILPGASSMLIAWLCLSLLFVAACSGGNSDASSQEQITYHAPPAPRAVEPNLSVAPNGRVILSWVEPAADETRHALRFSVHDDGQWSEPTTIAEGSDWFINWADFPSVVATVDHTLVAHWLQKSGPDTYAYGVKIARSLDRGKTWSAPYSPHPLDTKTEHGFVAMAPMDDGRLLLAWLDGRQFADTTKPDVMTLHGATMDTSGRFENDVLLDNRVCDCCQNAVAITLEGAVVVYRDRSDSEIRDIGIIRLENNQWTAPRILFDEGWEISGCPVNGPAVAAHDNDVVVAWFTMAKESPQVKLAFSHSAGATFLLPIRVDDGDPMGRVDIVRLEDGSAVVTWLEVVGEGTEIRARRVDSDGSMGNSFTIAETSPKRASGFPVIAVDGESLWFAWTEIGDPPVVRLASMPLDS